MRLRHYSNLLHCGGVGAAFICTLRRERKRERDREERVRQIENKRERERERVEARSAILEISSCSVGGLVRRTRVVVQEGKKERLKNQVLFLCFSK